MIGLTTNSARLQRVYFDGVTKFNKHKNKAMKKLSKIELKKVKGGQPPLCVQLCNYEYRFCLNNGGTLAECRQVRLDCINCECNNIC
jgi:hypothetical protein